MSTWESKRQDSKAELLCGKSGRGSQEDDGAHLQKALLQCKTNPIDGAHGDMAQQWNTGLPPKHQRDPREGEAGKAEHKQQIGGNMDGARPQPSNQDP